MKNCFSKPEKWNDFKLFSSFLKLLGSKYYQIQIFLIESNEKQVFQTRSYIYSKYLKNAMLYSVNKFPRSLLEIKTAAYLLIDF